MLWEVLHRVNIFCDRDAEQPPEGAQMLLNPKEDPDKLKTTSPPHTTFKRYIIFFIHFKKYMYAIVDKYQPQLVYFILKPAVLCFVPPRLEIYFMS